MTGKTVAGFWLLVSGEIIRHRHPAVLTAGSRVDKKYILVF
jgi:hypothetical protein